MANNQLPTIETLHKLLICDAVAGTLVWRERDASMFKNGKQSAEHNCNCWNGKHANKAAFITTHSRGYKKGSVLGVQLYTHRVIWAMETGEWPVDQIDHEDHKRANNKFGNLSEASSQTNGKNQSMHNTNTSGHTGVVWYKRCSLWQSQIVVNGKYIFLGRYEDINEAISARKFAENQYEFNPNHGCI